MHRGLLCKIVNRTINVGLFEEDRENLHRHTNDPRQILPYLKT